VATFMSRFVISILSLLVLPVLAVPASAQGAISSSRERGDKFQAPGEQVECGPIGCRPLPPGCRQVRLGGRWLDNNGLRVICDRRKN
jgi:hypothetical protein